MSIKEQITSVHANTFDMAKSMSSSVSLLMFLVVMESATLSFSYTIPSPASVKIYNQIAIGSPIQVHCKSRRNREIVPETTLGNGEHVQWGFRPSIWGSTRFNCNFKWGALRTQAFDVWVDESPLDFWDRRPCTHCVWHVTLDGFLEYEATSVLGTAVAQHRWKIATKKYRRSP